MTKQSPYKMNYNGTRASSILLDFGRETG